MCTSSAGAYGFGARLIEPVVEDRVGMIGSPTIGQHPFEAQVVCMESEQQVADVGPGLDTMSLRAGQDRVQNGSSWTGRFMAQEEPILSADGLMTKRAFADVVVDCQTTIFGVPT